MRGDAVAEFDAFGSDVGWYATSVPELLWRLEGRGVIPASMLAIVRILAWAGVAVIALTIISARGW